jgi:hypothetical protein
MRSNSFKVSDGKDEKIARGIIRAFLQSSKESEKGPPKDMISNNVPSTPNGTGNGGDTTTSTPQHSKPSKLELTSSARLSPILQSPSVEENVPTTEEPPSCEGTEETAENFSRSSFLRHSAHPNLGSHSEGRNPAMSPDQVHTCVALVLLCGYHYLLHVSMCRGCAATVQYNPSRRCLQTRWIRSRLSLPRN